MKVFASQPSRHVKPDNARITYAPTSFCLIDASSFSSKVIIFHFHLVRLHAWSLPNLHRGLIVMVKTRGATASSSSSSVRGSDVSIIAESSNRPDDWPESCSLNKKNLKSVERIEAVVGQKPWEWLENNLPLH
jgi:hypothetical protein